MFQRQEKGLNDLKGQVGPVTFEVLITLTLAGGALGKAGKESRKSTGLGAGKPGLDLCHRLSLVMSEPQFLHV